MKFFQMLVIKHYNKRFIIDANDAYLIKRRIVALVHPLRVQIAELLEEMTVLNVNEICDLLDMEQSVISQHLAIMRNADLIFYNTRKSNNKFHDYQIDKKGFKRIKKFARSLSSKKKVSDRMDDVYKIMRCFSHDLRIEIMQVINDNRDVYVGIIYNKHIKRLEQSIASQHLGIIRSVDAVNAQRDGKRFYYTLNKDFIQSVSEAMTIYLQESLKSV